MATSDRKAAGATVDYERTDLARCHVEPRPVLDEISIVIPTLNRPVLETCLQAILQGEVWPACLIVVDQSSSPDVKQWLAILEAQGLRTSYVPSDQTGRSAGLNQGIESAATRFIAITDDDCFVDKDWLAALLARLQQTPASIVSGRVEPFGDRPNVAVVTSCQAHTQIRPHLLFDHMVGGNMGASMEVVRRVGPFDEDPRLRTAEDCDWAYRALRAGVPLVYAPEVAVAHYGWRDSGGRAEQYRSYARSHGGFYGKHIRRGDLFIALRACVHLFRCLRRWLRGRISGNAEHALHGKMYVLNLVPGIWATMRGK